MKHLLLITAALAGILFALPACKQGPGQADHAAAASVSEDKPELFLYSVLVDNLNLREKPDRSGQVLAQFKEGELVESAGNSSTIMEEIELRGIPYRAPYYQITATGENRPVGWAFGGALVCVYAGTRAGSPDKTQLRAFNNFLLTLNPREVQSGGKAWAYVEEHFADPAKPLADAVFILFERFLRRMETEGEFYKITEAIPFTEAETQAVFEGKFNPDKYPATAQLQANGFRLAASEGSVFPVADWLKLRDYFGPKVTQPMQKFINQRALEQGTPFFDDGGIIIPLQFVADVAVLWEQFNQANPYFPLNEETRESERWLRMLVVNGADNTPVFEDETQSVVNEFRGVWEYVQQKYPNTETAKLAKQMADLCAAGDWKRTQKVMDFQAQLQQQEQQR